MKKLTSSTILVLNLCTGWATQMMTTSSSSNIKQQPTPVITTQASKVVVESAGVQTTSLSTSSAALSRIDSDAANLNKIKREIELQKLRAELDKVKNPIAATAATGQAAAVPRSEAQTVVTDVIINKETDKRIATLQFADGSYLDVENGSRVGGYIIKDISLTGAKLVKLGANGKTSQTVVLKRVYGRLLNDGPNSSAIQIQPKPTEITTTANLGAAPYQSSDSQVPPLVGVGG